MEIETIPEEIGHLRRHHDLDRWMFFDDFVCLNIEAIVERYSSRWLVSICDTYADYGSTEERAYAMMIVSFVNFERMVITLNGGWKGSVGDKEPFNKEIWDEVRSISCHGDAPVNWFGRLEETLLKHKNPFWHIFKEIKREMLLNPHSTLQAFNAYWSREEGRYKFRVDTIEELLLAPNIEEINTNWKRRA